jgi:hypothetical protein
MRAQNKEERKIREKMTGDSPKGGLEGWEGFQQEEVGESPSQRELGQGKIHKSSHTLLASSRSAKSDENILRKENHAVLMPQLHISQRLRTECGLRGKLF